MGFGVFAVALVVYGWTAAPALSWLDAAEFSTAAQTLSIAHPPGHPIPSLVARLLLYVPLGEAAFRVNLASALEGALAVAAVYVAARAVAARLVGARPAALIGAAAALGFGWTRAAWEQAARAEVYALQAALLLAALAWAVDWAERRDARALYAATFATGLALANHHFVAILFFVPVGLVVLARSPGVAAAGRLAALGILGLGAYLYLPLRAARDVLGWGDADRVAPFVWTVTAQAFQKSLAQPAETGGLGDVVTAVADNLSLPVAALALLGVYALARRGALPASLLLAGVAVCGIVGRALLGFEPDNPDALGYLLPAVAALAVLGAAGVAALASLSARAALPVAIVALVLPAVQLWRFAGIASFRGGEAADLYARAAVAAPSRAVVITSHFETHFLAVAAQRLEGERPDVTVIDRNLLTQPYAPAAARRRLPDLARLIDAPLIGGLPTPVAALAALARPVAMELAVNLAADDPVLPRLVPGGLLASVAPAPPVGDLAGLERAMRATASEPDRHGAERLIAWQALMRTRFYCATGRPADARAAAAALPPADAMLVPLAGCLRR